jgi:diguanylate cyclase
MPDSLNISPIDELVRFRTMRMRHLFIITFACVNIAMLLIFLLAYHSTTLLLLVGIDVMLVYGLYLMSKDRTDLAASVLLWSISVGLSLAVMANSGLRDPAIITFPAILFFAALVSSKREFRLLFLYFCVATVLIGLIDLHGLREQVYIPVNWPNIIIVLLVLSASSYSIRTNALDLKRALIKLESKNARLQESESKANYLAHYDYLTGLPNRVLCKDRFENLLKQSKRNQQNFALLFIDLDNFKTVNDSLGHTIGDQVLRAVADNLSNCLRDTDSACRFGGDEFIILLSSIDRSEDIERICSKILKMIKQPIQTDDHLIHTSASIGIVMVPNDGNNFDTCCKNADIAMYKAKQEGKNLYCFFDTSMATESRQRFALIKDLRNALKRQEFILHYQPKIDFNTGQITGAEALIRWQHPLKGMIPPDEFIGLSEETGLIIDIGEWVLIEACRQCAAWHAAGYNLEIAVNLSPIQFTRGRLIRQVTKALAQAKLKAEFLELELTESLLIGDSDYVQSQIKQLRQQGVTFSIDDFGTGYSNLRYLSMFDLECLKIDKTFISRILESKQDENIVVAIINVAKSLGLKTVAEGIENKLVLERLKILGCDLGQGYFWTKPLSNEAFVNYVKKTEKINLTKFPTRESRINKI